MAPVAHRATGRRSRRPRAARRAPSGPPARGQGRGAGAAFPAGARNSNMSCAPKSRCWRRRWCRISRCSTATPCIEVKPAAHTKDSAVSAFMEEEPFRGRQPIFIGDDQTDYGGFAAVRRFDGLAIAVGPRVKSEWWLPGPAAVRQWLGELRRGAGRELRRHRQLPGGGAHRRAGAHGLGVPAAPRRRSGVLGAAAEGGR